MIDLLLKSDSLQKFFFESSDKKISLVALGPTVKIAFKDAVNYLKNNPEKIIWSAMQFEEVENSFFYSSYFTLLRKDGVTNKVINNQIDYNEDILFTYSTEFKNPVEISSLLNPDYSEWKKMLDKALTFLHSQQLSKIVLKRKKIITFDQNISGVSLFAKKHSQNTETYNIFVQISPSQSFMSFTPEKLFSLSNTTEIETISIAGSAPRGQNKDEDELFEAELNDSLKLINEQGIVTEEICSRLEDLADNITTSP